MRKAVFLDRDGVINHPKKHYYVYRPEDFIINRGVIEALTDLQEKGYLLIVITNQGGISKGVYSKGDVETLHEHMIRELEKQGVRITAVYYCPHHPKNEACLCRKPMPLMLEKAMARFKIDPIASWFIGDKKTDVEAGRLAGVNTIRIWRNGDLRKVLKHID